MSGLWPTPTERDGSFSARSTCVRRREWASHPGTTLTDAVRLATAGLPFNAVAPQLAGSGSVNPAWAEALMGLPENWTYPAAGVWHGWPAPPEPLDYPQYAWEPARLARGVPNQGKRLSAIGNAVVPQCAAEALWSYVAGAGALRVGSLFSGLGGLELGAYLANPHVRVLWQSEIDPFCQQILSAHFPGATQLGDVRSVRRPAAVDLIVGGFPCQDVALGGSGQGLAGARSGLWFRMLTVVRRMLPPLVLVENSAALTDRGLDVVLEGLVDSGYTAEPRLIRASDVGAPHRRARMFIVAHR